MKSVAMDEKSTLVDAVPSVLGGRNAVGSMIKLQCGDASFVMTGQFIEWLQTYAASEGLIASSSTGPLENSGNQTKVKSALDKAIGALDTINAAPSAIPNPRTEPSSSAAVPITSTAKIIPPNDPRFPVYDYNDIVKGVIKDIDPAKKEQYLDNQVFFSLFGCTKEEFASQAKWKQTAKKKQLGLF